MNRRNFIDKGLAITAAFGLKDVLPTGTAEAKSVAMNKKRFEFKEINTCSVMLLPVFIECCLYGNTSDLYT